MISLSRIFIIILIAVNPDFIQFTDKRPHEKDEDIVFDNYEKQGLILAGRHTLFSQNIKKIGEHEFKGITAVSIIELSREMLTPEGVQKPCSKVHFVKVVAGPDTLILLGDVVAEIRESFNNLKLKNTTVSLHTASDFTMKAVNEEGLTGCDAFSYIVIQENDENFTLIYPPDPESYPYQCAVLQETDGISEGIENVSTMDNTLHVSILISYQEGSGSYTLKLYRTGNFWKSEETDRIRTYE